MSSFKITAKHRASGQIHEVWCLDDYFGRRRYGYIPNIEGGEALTESRFTRAYEPVDIVVEEAKGGE